MNTLIIIGPVGNKRAYLNVTREEALKAYRASEGVEPPPSQIQEIQFNKEFFVYDAWSDDE